MLKGAFYNLTSVEVEEKSVSQFAGIRDCGGIELYLGDTIEDTLTKAVYVIEFGFCKKYAFTGWYAKGINVDQSVPLNNDDDSDKNSHIKKTV